MSFWVLTSTGKVFSRTTVLRVTNLETKTNETKTRVQTFATLVVDRIGRGNSLVVQDEMGHHVVDIDDWDDPAYADAEFVQEFGRSINDPGIKEADQKFTPDVFDDTYLHMELALPREGGEVQLGRIVK
jgi:hypothetical protein